MSFWESKHTVFDMMRKLLEIHPIDCSFSICPRDELVVLPSWILDSIKAGSLLSVDQYLLYHGRKAAQKVLNFTSKPSSTCTITKPSPGGVPSVTTLPNVQSPQGGPSVDMSSFCSTSVPPLMGEASTSALLTTTIQEQSVDFTSRKTVVDAVDKDLESNTKEYILPQNSIAISVEGFCDNEEDTVSRVYNNDEPETCVPTVQRDNNSEKETSKPAPESSVFKKPATSSLPKAGDAKFVSEFYNNSRLHYLSTWGAEFKKYTSDIIKSSATKGWKGRGTGRVGPHGRVIMHIDMDSFFVSVTLRDQPHLRGKPIAVCHAGKSSSTTEQGKM